MEDKKNHHTPEQISDEALAAFLDGNATENDTNEIMAALNGNVEIRELIAICNAVDVEIQAEELKILPIHALAASNPENLCSFDCETFILTHLDYDIDHWSLLETAKANNWLREEGTPLHHVGKLLELKGLYVERRYDASLSDLERALDEGKEAIAIIDSSYLDSGVGDTRQSAGANSYHAIYVTGVEEDGSVTYLNLDTLLEEILEKDEFQKAWRSSSNYLVTASKFIDAAAGYDPQPIDVEEIPLSDDLEELTEAIAENAHDIWARARMDEGWRYGPVRDDAKKEHPDLVPYSRLPESEKEYDRLMAMNTLRLVRRLGYDITKNI